MYAFILHIQLSSTDFVSAALTWIMLELCKDLDLQARVRAELLAAFPAEDPTYDELTNDLPLLDAVLHEVLRVYPPLFGARRTVRRLYLIKQPTLNERQGCARRYSSTPQAYHAPERNGD
jgi:cytochrome P450